MKVIEKKEVMSLTSAIVMLLLAVFFLENIYLLSCLLNACVLGKRREFKNNKRRDQNAKQAG